MRFTLMPMTACFAIRGRPAQVAHGDAAKGAATREPNLGVSGALDRPGLDAAQRWNPDKPNANPASPRESFVRAWRRAKSKCRCKAIASYPETSSSDTRACLDALRCSEGR